MRLALAIAWRYLRARKNDRFISLIAGFAFLGIFLGVGTLIIVTSVMNGFRANLYDRILGMNGHISVFSYGAKPIADYRSLQNHLQNQDAILNATPVIISEILLTVNHRSDGAFVKGITAKDFQARQFFNEAFDGSVEPIFAEGKILIGRQMANILALGVGDYLTLYAPFGTVTAFGTLPKLQKMQIGGIFAFDMYEYDRNFIFMSLPQAQDLFASARGVSRIELVTPDPNLALRTAESIGEILPRGLYQRHWLQLNGSLYQAIEIERRVTYIVLTLVILIAALNIISAQMMLVKEKAHSIAILRSMGARRSTILAIFTATGLSIGLIGTICGTVAGVAIAKNIDVLRKFVEGLLSISLFDQKLYHLEELPALLNNTQTAVTVIVALLITFLAALYPAWRAARLNPAEVLRYE